MRRFFFVLLLIFVLCLTGCQAQTDIDVKVNANGSGSIAVVVTLDKEAAGSVPNLDKQLQINDLKNSGWKVDGPSGAVEGDVTIKVQHGFANATQANALLSQLSDPSGPFVNLHLDEKRTFTNTDVTFDGTIDLTNGITSFGSSKLATKVGAPLGFNPDEVQRALGIDWAKSFPVDVTLHLPGGTKSYVPLPGDASRWHLAYGQATTLHAHSTGADFTPLLFLGISVALLIAAAVVAIVWTSNVYRARHRKKRGGIRARDLLAQMETPTAGVGDESSGLERPMLQ